MAINVLEQLAAEWFEYSGYYVRRNVRAGKNELDVVALHPEKKKLVHIEASMDTGKWEKREARFKKKFEAGRKAIPGLFKGLKVPKDIVQIALMGHASSKNYKTIGGGHVVPLADFLSDIFSKIALSSLSLNPIPEQFIILRSFQFVTSSWAHVRDAWPTNITPIVRLPSNFPDGLT